MTETNEKLRSLFLAALMVTSVVAVGVSFTGAAAAQAANTDVTSAVEYTDSVDSNGDEITNPNKVELVFENDPQSVSVDRVLVNGETGVVDTTGSLNDQGERVVVTLDDDVTPNQNLTLDLDVKGPGADSSEELIVKDIETTATGIDEHAGANTHGDVTIVYQGEPIAIAAGDTQEDIQIRGDGVNI